jgi:Tfp pilus assembly protein PilE
MRSRQRGATFLGMVVIVAILGLGLYAVIRLLPLYTEYFAVARALEQTAKESENANSAQELRYALARRWAVEDIKSISVEDIDVKKQGSGFTMRAWYRAEAPFIANVSLTVTFDKSVSSE